MSDTRREIPIAREPPAERWARNRIRWRERLLGLAAVFLRPRDSSPLARRRDDGAPIVTYHRIVAASEQTTDPFAISERALQAQVKWLAQHFALITASELATRIRKHESVRGTAVITFDDGYDCTFSRAMPILKAQGAPATLFVATGRLDRDSGSLGVAQLAELTEAGVEIASHGVSHRDLRTLDDATLEEELRKSRELLARAGGAPVTGLAYPFGRFDERVIRAARESGYEYACSCRQHRRNDWTTSPYRLNRLEVNLGDSQSRFENKLEGRYARVYETWYRLNPATRSWLTD